MSTIIDGRKLARKINLQTKKRIDNLKSHSIYPGLAVIIIGDDDASQRYVRNKHIKAKKMGMKSIIKVMSNETTQDQLLNVINSFNNDNSINGILVQSPLPKTIDEKLVHYTIDPKKDVDAFNPINAGKLFLNESTYYPTSCTPSGIMAMLKEYNIKLSGKKAVVIGRSTIVGRPMTALLINADATVMILNHYTKNIYEYTKDADIIISATGQPNLINGNDIKKGSVVIDVGENIDSNGKLVGDINFDSVSKKASYITPVPGGVGPMTIAMLMKQTVDLTLGSEKING